MHDSLQSKDPISIPRHAAQSQRHRTLENVRQRLEARFGNAARMEIQVWSRAFIDVTLTLPAKTITGRQS